MDITKGVSKPHKLDLLDRSVECDYTATIAGGQKIDQSKSNWNCKVYMKMNIKLLTYLGHYLNYAKNDLVGHRQVTSHALMAKVGLLYYAAVWKKICPWKVRSYLLHNLVHVSQLAQKYPTATVLNQLNWITIFPFFRLLWSFPYLVHMELIMD